MNRHEWTSLAEILRSGISRRSVVRSVAALLAGASLATSPLRSASAPAGRQRTRQRGLRAQAGGPCPDGTPCEPGGTCCTDQQGGGCCPPDFPICNPDGTTCNVGGGGTGGPCPNGTPCEPGGTC